MKIVVNKGSLEVAVKNLVKVINPKAALPILGNVLFDVNEKSQTAQLTTSDAEVTMTYEVILTECEGEGRFCVNAQTLADMLTGVSEQPLTITATLESDMKFTMTFKDGSAYCPIEPADEYPMPVNGEYTEQLHSLESEQLRGALKRSLWATGDDDLRPVMNGVDFALVYGSLDIVASDGHVLVKTNRPVDNVEKNHIASFIMPKKVAKILGDILEEGDFITICWNDHEADFELVGCKLYFRLIEGRYPKYDSIIPREFAHEVLCTRIELLSALKSVAPFTPESSQLLVMTFDGDRLEICGDNFEFESGAVKSISVDGYEGEPLTIGVKASRIIGILSKLTTPEVLLKFNAPDTAIIIEPIDEDSKEEITCLLMPMLVN